MASRSWVVACVLALWIACIQAISPPPPVKISDVKKVSLTITPHSALDENWSSIQSTLYRTSHGFVGTIGAIPAGPNRIVEAKALNQDGTVLYYGKKQNIRVLSGQLTVVDIHLYSTLNTIGLSNSAPLILSIDFQSEPQGVSGVRFSLDMQAIDREIDVCRNTGLVSTLWEEWSLSLTGQEKDKFCSDVTKAGGNKQLTYQWQFKHIHIQTVDTDKQFEATTFPETIDAILGGNEESTAFFVPHRVISQLVNGGHFQPVPVNEVQKDLLYTGVVTFTLRGCVSDGWASSCQVIVVEYAARSGAVVEVKFIDLPWIRQITLVDGMIHPRLSISSTNGFKTLPSEETSSQFEVKVETMIPIGSSDNSLQVTGKISKTLPLEYLGDICYRLFEKDELNGIVNNEGKDYMLTFQLLHERLDALIGVMDLACSSDDDTEIGNFLNTLTNLDENFKTALQKLDFLNMLRSTSQCTLPCMVDVTVDVMANSVIDLGNTEGLFTSQSNHLFYIRLPELTSGVRVENGPFQNVHKIVLEGMEPDWVDLDLRGAIEISHYDEQQVADSSFTVSTPPSCNGLCDQPADLNLQWGLGLFPTQCTLPVTGRPPPSDKKREDENPPTSQCTFNLDKLPDIETICTQEDGETPLDGCELDNEDVLFQLVGPCLLNENTCDSSYRVIWSIPKVKKDELQTYLCPPSVVHTGTVSKNIHVVLKVKSKMGERKTQFHFIYTLETTCPTTGTGKKRSLPDTNQPVEDSMTLTITLEGDAASVVFPGWKECFDQELCYAPGMNKTLDDVKYNASHPNCYVDEEEENADKVSPLLENAIVEYCQKPESTQPVEEDTPGKENDPGTENPTCTFFCFDPLIDNSTIGLLAGIAGGIGGLLGLGSGLGLVFLTYYRFKQSKPKSTKPGGTKSSQKRRTDYNNDSNDESVSRLETYNLNRPSQGSVRARATKQLSVKIY
jgi:hypothetical protein